MEEVIFFFSNSNDGPIDFDSLSFRFRCLFPFYRTYSPYVYAAGVSVLTGFFTYPYFIGDYMGVRYNHSFNS